MAETFQRPANSVTRRLGYLFIIWPFTTIINLPNSLKIIPIFWQILYKPYKNGQRLLKISKVAKFCTNQGALAGRCRNGRLRKKVNHLKGRKCDQNKSPNVYKSCLKIISLEKWYILTPLQKLPKNVGI